MKLKWFLVVVAILFISYLHINMIGHDMASHVLHQELFFIPIILASFWFPIPSGIIISIVVSLIYSFALFTGQVDSEAKIAFYLQVGLYIGVAALIGWLTNRLHTQQRKIIRDERRATLAKLASAMSLEMRDIVNSLGLKYKKAGRLSSEREEDDFSTEIDRLERIVNAFSKIIPHDEQPQISRDLNVIILQAQEKFKERASNLGVNIKVELEEESCPSMVFSESMAGVFNSLIGNALEVSPQGSEIVLRSKRTGTYCSIEVIDQGPGVADENVEKLFTPFFSTKPGGFGLTLSSGRKVMRDQEGDILFERGKGGGSIFKMIVPRESRDKNIDTHVANTIR